MNTQHCQITLIAFICLCIISCGGSDTNPAGPIVDGREPLPDLPPGTNNLLNPISFSNNPLQLESRVVAYSKKAGRISIVDPVQQQEIWGENLFGYNFAIALPGLIGAALFNDNEILISTESSQRKFTIDSNYTHTATAPQQVAYSLSNDNGRNFEILRFMNNGEWQQQTFTVPWDAIDPSITSTPSGQPVMLATKFNSSGTMLAAFSPSDGRYAIYTADSINEPIVATTTWCAGDGSGLPTNASFISVAWDEQLQMFFAGDINGRIYAINPFGNCALFSNLPNIDMPDNQPIYRITIYGNGVLGIIQDTTNALGSLKLIEFDGQNFSALNPSYSELCEIPLSSIPLQQDYIVVLCTTRTSLLSDISSDAKNPYLEPRQYITLDRVSGTVVNTISIDKDFSAGIAVDAQNYTLYRMLEGAFGNLESTNLITGKITLHQGLYIKNSLN